MKKTYQQPQAIVTLLQTESLMQTVSGPAVKTTEADPSLESLSRQGRGYSAWGDDEEEDF